MSLIDLISNLAGLLFWVGWRSQGAVPPASTGLSLASTLKTTRGFRIHRPVFGVLFLALFLRGFFYWHIGSRLRWTALLPIGPVVLSFRSDKFIRIALFSFLSFILFIAIFYLSVLLFSLLQSRSEPAAQHKWVRAQLGFASGWPWWLRLLLPGLILFSGWLVLHFPLAALGIVPRAQSTVHLLKQSFIVGLGSYLLWKYVLTGILLLHLLNSYIYVGNYGFWNFINGMARRALTPFSAVPLRLGRFDFGPFVAIILIFLAGEGLARLLNWWYQHVRA